MELVSLGDEESGSCLLLRLSPHNVPDMSRVDMLAECPLDHPFFVKDKGKSSLSYFIANTAGIKPGTFAG